MIRPILLLDMDGPIADFDLAFWEYCQEQGFELNITGLDDPNRKRFMTENFIHDDERKEARRQIDKTRWFLDLPVTKGAAEGVPELMKIFDVWVCTKPLEVNPYCRDDKGAWLKRHFPYLEHKMILAPKKSLVLGDLLLDDAPDPNCMPYAAWKPVVFPSVFNQHPDSHWSSLPAWEWGDDPETLWDLGPQ